MGGDKKYMVTRLSDWVWFNDQVYIKACASANELEPYRRLEGHPSFPQLIDHWSEDGKTFVVMTKLDGVTLDDARFDVSTQEQQEKYLAMAERAFSALDYAHSKHMFFFDLGPCNLLLDTDRAVINFIDLDGTVESPEHLKFSGIRPISTWKPHEFIDTHSLAISLLSLLSDETYRIFQRVSHPIGGFAYAFCQQKMAGYAPGETMHKILSLFVDKLRLFI